MTDDAWTEGGAEYGSSIVRVYRSGDGLIGRQHSTRCNPFSGEVTGETKVRFFVWANPSVAFTTELEARAKT